MDVEGFAHSLPSRLPRRALLTPTRRYGIRGVRRLFDPCPDVQGFTAIKVQKLLSLAVACLDGPEAYLEIGSHQGKTLISALKEHRDVHGYACDDFSQFAADDAPTVLERNLTKYELDRRVTILRGDFRYVVNRETVSHPIGVYLYDAAHDRDSQREGILHVESLLADRALVIVDDWQHTSDPAFAASAGTRDAIMESSHNYKLLFDLPSRRNRDSQQWWNGVGVLSFARVRSRNSGS